mmetsp:Transcript_16331/g.35296  ORF Transcript_16331/g.35296 Transcript_16331/m.35296 type:complete len:372 (-) Transcript_16331:303-1418(-)
MKFSKVRLIQLSIVRNGITPIILTFRVGIIPKMIVRPIKCNVQRGVHPPREIIVPLSWTGPPPLPGPRQPSRRHLVRARGERLPHRHLNEGAVPRLYLARLDLENVDFGSPPPHALVEPKVFDAIARADELCRAALLGADAGAPRPNVFGTPHVGVPREVAQQPKCRPESPHVVLARQCNFRLHDSAREAEFVPRLEHGAFEMFGDLFPLARHVVEPHDLRVRGLAFNDQIALRVRISIIVRVIMLRIIRIIILFQRRPSWIIAILKCSMRSVEFITEHEIINSLGLRGRRSHGAGRRGGSAGRFPCWKVRGRLCGKASVPFVMLFLVVVVSFGVFGWAYVWDDFQWGDGAIFFGCVFVDPAGVAGWELEE